MSTTIIQGYGVESKKLDLEITRKTVNFLKPRRQPIQFGSSAPVIELLGGTMDWAALQTCVKKPNGTFPPFDEESALGLVIPDLADHGSAVAFRLPVEGNVIPAVILKVSGTVWVAEACVFETKFLASSMITKFNSASVAALLDQSCGAFRNVLINPLLAASRLTYVRDTNEGFFPDDLDNRKWTIASHWPDWQRQQFALPACMYALSKLENCTALNNVAFAQIVKRLGLRIRDKSDCPFVPF